MQRRQVAFLNGETGAHGRYVQQVEHFTDGKAAVRQLEQMLQGNEQWVATTLALVSMAGSMTMTSRGRSVGSALKRASNWSWRISTSRCGLWASRAPACPRPPTADGHADAAARRPAAKACPACVAGVCTGAAAGLCRRRYRPSGDDRGCARTAAPG
ncbi:hypothetical protein WR25_12136 [Diploscapter pachys]|uniref:Uncharacterized protein n=1 Tax=Diploscapter pachys TaxID=2018661 RepID=A0A2A2KFT0_9BILA|nr:hypothetical protein WR25_12136 [Diploscapter pachys]